MKKLGPVGVKSPERPISVSEAIGKYELISVDNDLGYLIVTERKRFDDEFTKIPSLSELGGSATRWRRVLGGEEYNPELMGINGLQLYDRMRRSDATIHQSLVIAKTPVLQGRWWVEAADPDDEFQVMIAEFIEKALFDWMSIGWTQFLTESLLMLDYGYYFFEKVFEFRRVDGVERLVWKKFAPRHPLDVEDWEFDAHGGPRGVFMQEFEEEETIWLPIDKLLVFSYQKEAGNIEGISVLRSSYKHWYYKENLYKIDAIQKERHSVGIPVIKLPPNYNKKDKELAEELGRNLRANEQAHVVLPPLWELEFAEVRGNPVDVVKSIEHHDMKIKENVLAGFLTNTSGQGTTTLVDLYLKASRHIADILREVINKHAIPELVFWNWPGITEFPKLRVRRIGEVTDLRTLTFALRNLIGADALRPDDDFEEWAREEFDLPRRDEDSDRVQEGIDREIEEQKRQEGANAGLPRQGPPSAGQGEGTGDDNSGG